MSQPADAAATRLTGAGADVVAKGLGWPSPKRGDDWGVSDPQRRRRPERRRRGLYNARRHAKLASATATAAAACRRAPITERYRQVDRAGTWLKRPPTDYRRPAFDRYWVPNETLLEEWVRKSVKKVLDPDPRYHQEDQVRRCPAGSWAAPATSPIPTCMTVERRARPAAGRAVQAGSAGKQRQPPAPASKPVDRPGRGHAGMTKARGKAGLCRSPEVAHDGRRLPRPLSLSCDSVQVAQLGSGASRSRRPGRRSAGRSGPWPAATSGVLRGRRRGTPAASARGSRRTGRPASGSSASIGALPSAPWQSMQAWPVALPLVWPAARRRRCGPSAGRRRTRCAPSPRSAADARPACRRRSSRERRATATRAWRWRGRCGRHGRGSLLMLDR